MLILYVCGEFNVQIFPDTGTLFLGSLQYFQVDIPFALPYINYSVPQPIRGHRTHNPFVARIA